MFHNAETFNGNLSGWDVRKKTAGWIADLKAGESAFG
jgi:hypothetical protein